MRIETLNKLEIPEDWQTVRLVNLIIRMDAGVSVNSGSNPSGQGEYGILKTSAVSNGIFSPGENKVISAAELLRAKTSPVEGCIIMSRMNTPALVGASAYVTETRNDLFLPDRLCSTPGVSAASQQIPRPEGENRRCPYPTKQSHAQAC